MKVYLVFDAEWDDYDDAKCLIIGVFSSRETAEQVAGRYRGYIKVQELELDKELNDMPDAIYLM